MYNIKYYYFKGLVYNCRKLVVMYDPTKQGKELSVTRVYFNTNMLSPVESGTNNWMCMRQIPGVIFNGNNRVA